MTEQPICTEQITDSNGTYEQQWFCKPPLPGTNYHVVRCTWSADHTVRKIYEVRLGDVW